MTQWIARVGTATGQIEELTYQADDEAALRRELADKGYHVFSVRRGFSLGRLGLGRRAGRRRIGAQEFIVFNQELAALLRAGLPLLQSLDIMLERMKNPTFRRVLVDVRDRVKSGTSLSDAFRAHGDLFPRIYSASLLGGEKSGSLEDVLQRYVRYLKLTDATRKKVVAALVYPVILSIFLVFAAAVLLFWVVPRFEGFYEGFEAELPLLTVVFLAVGTAVADRIGLIAAALAGIGAAFYVWSRREESAVTLDRLKLRAPFVGPVLHLFATSQLMRSLATLLAGGIPLVQSIEVAAGSIGNRWIGRKVAPVAERVREGKSFAASLEQTGEFSNLAIEMVKVGESTGSLAEMLSNVADFSDEEIETRLDIMLSMLTPVMLMVMGGFVALILLALYLPLFSIASAVR